MPIPYQFWNHIHNHRGAYCVLALLASVGFSCGWTVAASVLPDRLEYLAWIISHASTVQNPSSSFWITLLVSLGQIALVLAFMLAASFSRWTIILPPAVVTVQSYVMGCTLHMLLLVDSGWVYRVALTGIYGIIILGMWPLFAMGAVLCMANAWQSPRLGRSLRERLRHQDALLLVRNLLFLLLCGIPASLMQSIFGSVIH